MFAIVKTGGRQYRVQKDLTLRVHKIEKAPGEVVELEDVLLINDGKKVTTGTPYIKGAKVIAAVVDQIRDKKIIVFKKKRRKNYRRKKGHRQHLTVLKINDIVA